MISAVGVLAIGIPFAMSFAERQAIDTAHIELSAPMEIVAFMAAIKEQAFDEVILESSFVFEGQEIYDFHIVQKDEQDEDVTKDYINDRKGLITDVKGVKDFSEKDLTELRKIKIKKATLTGTKGNIDEVKKNLKIEKIESADETRLKQPQPEHKEDIKTPTNLFVTPVSAATSQLHPMYKYLPTAGTSNVGDSATVFGERYTKQDMRWDNNYFAYDETYEHKFHLDNQDSKSFLNGDSTTYPNCYPTVTYAATTWGSASKPYLDTRFDGYSCETVELSYTIGAAQADAITTNTNHYNYIRTKFGNDSSDRFKIQGSVGYRNPDFCYTTWCAAKYQIYTIVPSWNTAVPGIKSWTFAGLAPQKAPSNLTVTSPTASSLKINFTDNTYDETTIRIERKIAGGTWSEWGYFGLLEYTGSWNWINTGLQSKTTYCYRLRAKNALGYSSYSNTQCGLTQ